MNQHVNKDFEQDTLEQLYSWVEKKFSPTCMICNQHQASPVHILMCVGLARKELFSTNFLQTLDFLSAFNVIDIK